MRILGLILYLEKHMAGSVAYDIMEEECRAARPLIKKSVERIVDQYDFPQLERDEIMYTIADVLTNRLLPEKDIK